MRICFFDGTDRIELGARSSPAGTPSMLREGSEATRIQLREPWQAERFVRRHCQVASKLWSGELCAYVYPYQRPASVRVPTSLAVEEGVAPVATAARKRLPVKASSESASRHEPVLLTFIIDPLHFTLEQLAQLVVAAGLDVEIQVKPRLPEGH